MSYTSANDNERSSFRLAFLVFFIMLAVQFVLFSVVFFIEIHSEEINYNGLALLYGTFFGEGILAFLAKAWNKKQER